MYLLQAILSVIGPVLGRAFPVQAERKSPRPRVIDQNAAFTRLCPFVLYGEALANELLFMLPIATAAKSCGRQGNTMLSLNQIKITPRDQQVLQLLVQGCSNKDIAA